MTLLISALTKDHAFIASDRRLAFLDPSGNVRPSNDDVCKLIHYDGRFLAAYTGPANLGSPKDSTDTWIAKTLQYCEEDWDIHKALRNLSIELKKELSKLRSENQYFSAIFVGWEYFKGEDTLKPAFGIISTYIDGNLKKVPLSHKDGVPVVCWSFRQVFDHQLPFIFPAGQDIDEKRRIQVKRTFRKRSNKHLSQNLALDILYREIVHSSNNNKGKDWIGKGVLAAAMSAESTTQSYFMTHEDIGSGQQFRYYPHNSRKHIVKAPHAVSPGGPVITDFEVIYSAEDSYTVRCTVRNNFNEAQGLPDRIGHLPWTRIQ